MEPPKDVFTPPATGKGSAWLDKSNEGGKKSGKTRKGGKDPSESLDLTSDEGGSDTSTMGESSTRKKKVKVPESAEDRKARGKLELEMLSKQGTNRLFKTPPPVRSHSAGGATPKPTEEGERTGKSKRGEATPSSNTEIAKKARKEAGAMPRKGEASESASESGMEEENVQYVTQIAREFRYVTNMIVAICETNKIKESTERRLNSRLERVGRLVLKIEEEKTKEIQSQGVAEEQTTADKGTTGEPHPQIEPPVKVSADTGTQTPASWAAPGGGADKEAIRQNRRREMEEIELALEKGGFDELNKIKGLTWHNEVYKNVKEGQEEILQMGWEWDLALPVTRAMTSKLAEDFGQRFKATGRLQAKEYGVGQVAHLTETVGIRGEKEEDPEEMASRRVYYPVVATAEGEPWINGEVFESISNLRGMVASQLGRKIAMAAPETCHYGFLKKAIQMAFNGTDIEVMLVMPMTAKRASQAEPPGSQAKQKRRLPPREEAVIVRKQDGKTYADLLREVKRSVNIA